VALADVDCILVILAVVRVVTHRLHANLLAVTDHDVLVVARGAGCLHALEII